MDREYLMAATADSMGSLLSGKFGQMVLENDLRFMVRKHYPGEELFVEDATWSINSDHGDTALWVTKDAVALIGLSYGEADISVAATTQERAAEFVEEMEQKAPLAPDTDPKKVRITFWSFTPDGPFSVRRALDVPHWEEIKVNYTENTLQALEKMIRKDFRPGRGGQFFLWHGDAGTGKTTALRALANEWRDWCDVEYIVDPDRFFGSEAAYMMQVLIQESHNYHPGQTNAEDDEKWRLLILEDCGEMLTVDARQEVGQGLSRFLNAVDGLIGQGLRIMVLVTTNEPIGKLHEAVQRPGRCAANIEFGELKKNEVVKWIKAHNVDKEVPNNPATLAKLYALIDERIEGHITNTVGFSL